jgi:hypothetical protein
MEPGYNKHNDYTELQTKLKASENSFTELPRELKPMFEGNDIPDHWCRVDRESLYIYFQNPKADNIKFPLEYGESLETENKVIKLTIQYEGKIYVLDLVFEPYQSLLYKIKNGNIEQIDIEFIPETPDVKERPKDYFGPWRVK